MGMETDSRAYHKLAPVFLMYLGTIYYVETTWRLTL